MSCSFVTLPACNSLSPLQYTHTQEAHEEDQDDSPKNAKGTPHSCRYWASAGGT